MIPLPPSTRIFLACGATDMRKGFDGLAVMTQQVLEQSPHSGALFAFIRQPSIGHRRFGRFPPICRARNSGSSLSRATALVPTVAARCGQAQAPVKAIARGKATFGTLAHVVVSKFDHHLPLYRQAEIMAAQGIEIDRSTLARWVGQASVLLDPIISRIREVGLTASKIHTDGTPVPMLDPGRGKTATGRLWAYAVDDRGSGATTPPLVWYEFTTDRTGAHLQRQLASFTGYLQADGYAGYDKLYDTNRVTEVACWAHFRRKLFDIHATKPTPLTTDLLERIGQLYEIEAEVRGQQPDVRRRSRQDRTLPLIQEFSRLSTMPCGASRPNPRWPRRLHMATNAGSR
ncbi:IS66 family transposase [Mesorhizobium sp. M1088]|uniref:IS66 family transposase n=1 Tax=Mesorhizobium sp. M1088 TaxID=2957056 RepID=UPI00333ADFC6